MESLALLDTPNFSFDPATRPYKAGVRPFRKGSYRLEADPNTVAGKLLVHNYGHAGAGITMSWGCAEIVRDIVLQHGAAGGVAVLGAGVMGLTAATLLCEVRPSVEVMVYAEKFTPDTTSDVAGGQWSPSLVRYNSNDSAAKLAYFDILRRARKAHERRGPSYGVSQRWNYTPIRLGHLDELPTDIVPKATVLHQLPFARLTKPGFKYDLLLVETPILMARLYRDLETGGVRFVRKKLESLSDIARLSQSVIVNCTGLGSRELFNDTNMFSIKGQLVRLRPQSNLNYLFSGDGYVFPRTDAVLVGGSTECNVDNDTPVDADCKNIVKAAEDLFEGRRFRRFFTRPSWLSQDK